MNISIVITIKNESHHIRAFLDSVLNQTYSKWELIIVDSMSDDGTYEIIEEYQQKNPNIKCLRQMCTRGEGRNIGVHHANGSYIVFTDGDVLLDSRWLEYMVADFKAGKDIVAGKSIQIGHKAFVHLERVPIYVNNIDVTYPSCNLGYRKALFLELHGFDPAFVTAEDIDLNIRAVKQNKTIFYDERAVIYHRTRSTYLSFYKQAFWNGYGRKQLVLKHGPLWKNYKFRDTLRSKSMLGFAAITRMVMAYIGYIYCTLKCRS